MNVARFGMQTGEATWKFSKRAPPAASASIWGVLSTGWPAAPSQSARCWSVMMMRKLGRSFIGSPTSFIRGRKLRFRASRINDENPGDEVPGRGKARAAPGSRKAATRSIRCGLLPCTPSMIGLAWPLRRCCRPRDWRGVTNRQGDMRGGVKAAETSALGRAMILATVPLATKGQEPRREHAKPCCPWRCLIKTQIQQGPSRFQLSPCFIWWSQAESNRRPLECHSSALPTELWPPGARSSLCVPVSPAHVTKSARRYSNLFSRPLRVAAARHPQCPSGDFMSRMNRLSGAPS